MDRHNDDIFPSPKKSAKKKHQQNQQYGLNEHDIQSKKNKDKKTNKGSKDGDESPASIDADDSATSSSKSNKATTTTAPPAASTSNAQRKQQGSSFNSYFSRLIAFLVLFIILSRYDFFTLFGARSGRNLAHLSPLSISVYGLHHHEMIQKNKKFALASKKVSIALGIPRELLNDATDIATSYGTMIQKSLGLDEKPVADKTSKMRQKNKKFNIEDEEKTDEKDKNEKKSYDYWKRSEEWVNSVVNDRSIKAAVQTNQVLFASAVGLTLSSIFAFFTIPRNVNVVSFTFLVVLLSIAIQADAEVKNAGMICSFLLLIANLAA